MEVNNYIAELKNVSETLLVPLYFKAKETLENGIVKDNASVEIIKKIQYDFNKMANDRDTQFVIALRTQILDKIVTEYTNQVNSPTIVNLGAGLDTRHLRFNESIKWYQLDLKQPMRLRSLFFNQTATNITKSIFDFSWRDDVNEKENVLIIIEGVLMYLDETQVKSIFKAIGQHFRNSYIAFDTIPESYVNMKKHQSINMQQAPFKWGNHSLSEIERWGYGLQKIKNHYYLSENYLTDKMKGFKVSVMKIN